MKSLNQLFNRINDPSLTRDERVKLRCQLSKELEDIGNYEAAREAMGDSWVYVGERPSAADPRLRVIHAELLVRRCGQLQVAGPAGFVLENRRAGQKTIAPLDEGGCRILRDGFIIAAKYH